MEMGAAFFSMLLVSTIILPLKIPYPPIIKAGLAAFLSRSVSVL
jgi:hypothetical protein